MRYIILKTCTKEEVASRKKYIEKISKMYFIPRYNDEVLEFISLPINVYNCTIIIGHNWSVYNYLNTHKIQEKIIVIISCKFCYERLKLKGKEIYITDLNETGENLYFDGNEWGLNFLITKAELKFLNNTGDVISKIKKVFRRIS